MSKGNDVWYVRFPDGQVMRAPSTEAVRHQLDRGRIPAASRVRRTPEDEWVTLEWMPEFADLLGSHPPAARPGRGRSTPEPAAPSPAWEDRPPPAPEAETWREDRMQLRAVGVRGMAEELWSALDSSLAKIKLRAACGIGLAGAVVLVLAPLLAGELDSSWRWLAWAGAGLVVLVLGAMATTLLTQMTFHELSQARPPRWADARIAFGRNTLRLVLAYLSVLGSMVLAIWLLSRVPAWLPADLPDLARKAAAGGATVLRLVLFVLLGPLLGLALLLGPIVVVEDASLFRALRLWRQLLRQYFSRIFLYETLAAALAGVASLPLVVPLVISSAFLPPGTPGDVAAATLGVLGGLAAAPLITYLLVANLFVYLNLRYEQGPRR